VLDRESDLDNYAVTLHDIITRCGLEDQRRRLQHVKLSDTPVMWSSYDESDPRNPFRALTGGKAEILDRLGMGQVGRTAAVVKWGHRLPDNLVPHTPTAWDGGVTKPYWYPGGRTRPLSADGGGTGRFTKDDGLPEIVHDAITGEHLAIRIEFVAD
jgi:hypothetical protein